MSRGPGIIEQRIADLFAATRDRALSIDEIVDNAYELGGRTSSRAQRLSATRAAHRLLRRVRMMHEQACRLRDKAHDDVRAAIDRDFQGDDGHRGYVERLNAYPLWINARALFDKAERIGVWCRMVPAGRPGYSKLDYDFWCATTIKGRLWFHPPDVPVRVWAVSIQPAGVIWAEAQVTKITDLNVMVRYAGEVARLDRYKLWHWWAFWRGLMFVSSRTGRIAARLDQTWQRKYGRAAGGVPPAMQMPLAKAIELLGVPANYTKEDIIAGFRQAAKKAHPDAGGTAEMFRTLVEARDRLLAALGTSAPQPKAPAYGPKGTQWVYRVGRSRQQGRLGSTTRYLR